MPRSGRSKASLVVATAAATALVSAPASAGDGRFGRGENVEVEHPISVAVGDFNSDGRPDLVAPNYTAAYVHVRLGAPGGGFVPGPNVPVLTGPETVVVADFNADGHDDVAVSQPLSGRVSVRLGLGDGTFFTARDVELARTPTSVAVGDFNGDNRDDLAIPNSNSGGAEVAVRLAVGDGTFTDGGKVDVEAREATVGDFNSDGIEDLVGGSRDPDVRGRVLIGTGGGRFAAGGPIPLPGAAIEGRSWAVGDFNRDGNHDVAVAIRTEDVVSVRFGVGDGTFARGPDVPTGDAPSAVAVADFDSDGDDDLAVTNRFGLSVSMRLGDGVGGFTAAADVPVGHGPIDVAAADFDGDGNEDLVVANGLGGSLSVRPGLGATPLNGNLLVNGGFEGPTAASLHTRSPAIPGWERSGGMTYIRYGIPAGSFFPSRLAAPRWNGGDGLLWGGNSASSGGITEASQSVDVSRSAAAIDAQGATANLSAHLGGALDVPDVMDARAEFLSAGGATLGSLAIGPATIADRRRHTMLVPRAASAPVPAGTRRIRVTLTSTDADKSYSSATADNVKLTLDAPPPTRPGGQPSTDRQAPAIGRLGLTPRRFKVARRATTIRYTLTESASVTLRIQRLRGGRRIGTLRRIGRAGGNRIAFSGRIGRRALRPGAYRITATATDAAGNRSQSRTTRFRIESRTKGHNS